MVTRKPLPENAMLDPAASSQARMQDNRQQSDPDNIWANAAQQSVQQQGGFYAASEDVPASLRPGASTNYNAVGDNNVWADAGPETEDGGSSSEVARVPTVLKPGSGGVKGSGLAAGSQENEDFIRVPTVLRPGGSRTETNPFKRMKSVSQEKLEHPSSAPSAPPVPVASFSQLSVGDSSNNPWQPALGEEREAPASAPQVPGALDQETGVDIWDSAKPSRQATPGATSNSPALLSLPSDQGSAGWEDEELRKAAPPVPTIPLPNEEVLEDSHAWDDLGNVDKGKGPARPPQIPNAAAAASGVGDDWNLIDIEAPPGPPPKQGVWEKLIDPDEGVTQEASSSGGKGRQDGAPELPPRKSAEAPPPQPPRPVDKSETYQIKNITWHDVTAATNPRISPILVQNANGPCPLVALVNALSLTTPADKTNTALVETLRSREQVSLGLLLDAVFDELMSERRTNPAVDLPDVTELYDFLKGLHTGMNVNPRFIPTSDVVTAFKRTSLTHLHPTERGDLIPGTFEQTKEMALYATFAIPLIHGWIPATTDAAYDSFSRQAVSYEDAQNLLFREEELEEKLSSSHHEGLTEEEQQIYQDILTIKSFLSISATQLTQWGLEVIRKSMMPATVAILFRNDHFSTLYKHPQTQELLTLVTDAGYAGHAEVVWESLVDVNGEHAEFFSGDFRLVGGASHAENHHRRSQSESYHDTISHDGNTEGWTTVQGGRGRNQTPPPGQSESVDPPMSPAHEQEDRDLALALQLQEEEDERHRTEQARRRRESILSEQFIEQQARTGSSPAAGRGGPQGGGAATGVSAGRGSYAAAGRGVSQTSLGSSGPPAPARRSSNGVNIPVTTTGSPTGLRVRPAAQTARPTAQTARPTAQTVRSLIPPRTPAVNRPAEEGLDEAPPSYEQAAKQTPYVPPAGHPSHPSSAPSSVGDGSAPPPVVAGPGAGVSSPSPSPLINRAGRTPAPGGFPGRMRQGIPPAQAAAAGGRERDRDCIVM